MIKIDGREGAFIRTVFSVIVTPFLLSVCAFFLIQFYNDQKDIKLNQSKILIELGKINTKSNYFKDELDKSEDRINGEISIVKVAISANAMQIMDLWKKN